MAEGKIRIKDIAKIAGVSATTVSNVIHGRTEKVSRKTRKRIEEILDEQEYAPSMGARILSGKSSGMIAVVVGKRQEWEQESEKLEEILREIEKSLDEREYYMLLHFVKTAQKTERFFGAKRPFYGLSRVIRVSYNQCRRKQTWKFKKGGFW